MLPRWMLLLLTLVGLVAGLPVLAELSEPLDLPELEELPDVSARPPAAPPPPEPPLWLLGQLPPAARADDVPPPAGLQVQYTVDPALDAHARRVLDEGRVALGNVIVMDARSGALLSYVSTNPTSFPGTRIYPTASLMKVVTAAAVLRNSPEAAERDCRYAGSPYRVGAAQLKPPREGGRIDSFWRALAISNNQCFARLAVNFVGKDALVEEMGRVGLLEPPGAGHTPGRVEPIDGDLALGHLGSGLSGSFISPLAAVRLAAVLAEGKLVQPHWVAGIRDAEGRPLPLPDPPAARSVWPPELAAELRELMVGVVAKGTAKSAFRDTRGRPLLGDVRVAGKTGSLSGTNPKGRYEWFIGVAPAEAPTVAIATVVVSGSVWWRNASQVSALVLKEVFCEAGRCRAENAERRLAAARAVPPGV